MNQGNENGRERLASDLNNELDKRKKDKRNVKLQITGKLLKDWR